MEHLEVPEELQSAYIKVPYLGIAPKYDGLGFHDFPARHNIDPTVLVNADAWNFQKLLNDDTVTLNYLESFLQEWLWFGLLHEFETLCGIPVDKDVFIRDGGLGPLITTESLLPYVRAVASNKLRGFGVPSDLQVGDLVNLREGTYPEESIAAGPFKIQKCNVNLTYEIPGIFPGKVEHDVPVSFLSRVDQSVDSSSAFDTVPLTVLCQHLDDLFHLPCWTGQSTQPAHTHFIGVLQMVRHTTQYLLSHDEPILGSSTAMSIDILCQSLSEAVKKLFNIESHLEIESQHYSSKVQELMAKKNWCSARIESLLIHSIFFKFWMSLMPSHESVSHEACQGLVCSQRPQGLVDLQVKHTENCGGDCLKIQFDEKELVKVLASGGIPGVAQTQLENGRIKYGIIDVTGQEYIAVSHVWSHGLGNPFDNALPHCQVDTLFKQIQNIGSPNVLLWIDTLVVPIQLEYKRMAIMQLRNVYRQAKCVLVIDIHLQQVGSHWLERRLQLLCSEWMKRLWTLQEGRLARALYIQFRDEAVSLQELDAMVHPETLPDSLVFSDLYRTTQDEFSTHFYSEPDMLRQFSDLTVDLSHRSVTIASDEPICIATLIGLPLENYDPYPTMIDIYKALPSLPSDLVFVPSPRLTTPGYRWAPATYLELYKMWMMDDIEPTVLLPQGLTIRKDCIFLQDSSKFDFQFRGVAGRCYVRNGQEITFSFSQTSATVSPKSYENAAIILRHTKSTFRNFSHGVLVSGVKDVDGVMYAKMEMSLDVWKWNKFTQGSMHFNSLPSLEDEDVTEGLYQSEVLFCVD